MAAWQITDGSTPRMLLLCPAHDEQIRIGLAGWIPNAIPLAAL